MGGHKAELHKLAHLEYTNETMHRPSACYRIAISHIELSHSSGRESPAVSTGHPVFCLPTLNNNLAFQDGGIQ